MKFYYCHIDSEAGVELLLWRSHREANRDYEKLDKAFADGKLKKLSPLVVAEVPATKDGVIQAFKLGATIFSDEEELS